MSRSLFARFFTPLRSDPDLPASNATPTEMKTAVPMKWVHADFACVPATRTCLADRFTEFRIEGILIAHGMYRSHYIGVKYSQKARRQSFTDETFLSRHDSARRYVS